MSGNPKSKAKETRAAKTGARSGIHLGAVGTRGQEASVKGLDAGATAAGASQPFRHAADKEGPRKVTWREEIIGDARLILGDCREVLPTLGKVDAVVTDPPYSIRNKFTPQFKLNGTRTLNFAWDTDEARYTAVDGVVASASIAPAFFSFCGVTQISVLESQLDAIGFTVKPAVWVKACPPPAMPGNWWPSGFEYALYGYRQGAYFASRDTRRSNVFYSDTYRHGIRAEEKVAHPTQKWLPLICEIVDAIVPPGGSCIDPFMGSGTTGVACAKLGRKFIGIEIEPKYFDIACRRIDDAYKQPRLFLEPKAPKATKAQEVNLLTMVENAPNETDN